MANIVGGENLRTFWEQTAREHADRTFLIFVDCANSEHTFTYAQFNGLINRTANFLLEQGVAAGENVGVQLYNSPETLAVLFALAKIGAVAVVMNIQHMLEECVYEIEKCGIGTLICDPEFQSYYRGPGSYPVDRLLVCHKHDGELLPDSVDMDEGVASQPDVLPQGLDQARPLHPTDTCEILFTSGTTSRPKGVELTHANFLFSGYYGNWEYAMGPDDRFLTTMPAFHSNLQLAALTPVMTVGATLVFVSKYHATTFWKQVRHYRATIIQLVAMMARTMMLQPENDGDRDHCVRAVQYYLPISDAEKDAFERRFGVRLQNCYGLTESICWSLTDFAYGSTRWPSVGRPGLGYEVEILREDGTPAPVGECGSIAIKGDPGYSLMKGYYNDPEKTAQTLTPDGWLLTGDTGYRDESGWFFFVDRDSNMIKRSGENISASEVEGVISQHPAVAEVAVIGVPDPVRDQAVKAFVVLREGQHCTPRDLVAFCADRLAHYKVPSFVDIVDELPHTSVGKVEKKLLH